MSDAQRRRHKWPKDPNKGTWSESTRQECERGCGLVRVRAGLYGGSWRYGTKDQGATWYSPGPCTPTGEQ